VNSLIRKTVRPVAATVVAPVAGFVLIYLLELVLDFELSRLASSLVNLAVVAPIAFLLFPQRLGIPFGQVATRIFLRRVGLYFPDNGWIQIRLGIFLALITLSGILSASMLTGRYTPDPSTINLPHLVFSLNPGLWEELFYRGVLMLWLLRRTGSMKRSVAIQVILFGLMHIKGSDLAALVDVLSVMVLAAGFTYVAFKTRTLLAGIAFHFLHDALLFFVQVPGGVYTGVREQALFYGLLWLSVAAVCGLVKLATDKLGARAPAELYVAGSTRSNKPRGKTLQALKIRSEFPNTQISAWFKIAFDEEWIRLHVSPPDRPSWSQTFRWADIERVCFEAEAFLVSDGLYIFTRQHPESYHIPIDGSGGRAFWNEIIRRGLFDAEMALEVATAAEGVRCWPPVEQLR
jgi:membrane protease YdiL (CAAX protease family)